MAPLQWKAGRLGKGRSMDHGWTGKDLHKNSTNSLAPCMVHGVPVLSCPRSASSLREQVAFDLFCTHVHSLLLRNQVRKNVLQIGAGSCFNGKKSFFGPSHDDFKMTLLSFAVSRPELRACTCARTGHISHAHPRTPSLCMGSEMAALLCNKSEQRPPFLTLRVMSAECFILRVRTFAVHLLAIRIADRETFR